MSLLLVVLLLWLPGALLHRGLGWARGPWGTGRFAVEATLSLAFLSLVLLPLYLAAARIELLPAAVLVATAALATTVLASRHGRRGAAPRGLAEAFAAAGPWDGASAAEIAAFLVAIALLLPATLAHSGANVDDWWDLSFVSGWLAEGRVGFSQMALSPDPATHASPMHPRFLWSVWLMLQALVAWASGEAAWRIQAGPLAAATVVLVVSAQAALSRALCPASPARMAAVTALATAAWIWGTEALPLFVRGYQDKLFAAFVLAPVLVALVLRAAADDDAAGEPSRSRTAGQHRRLRTLAVAAAAVATVSVHSLVYTMAAFAGVVALAAHRGRGVLAWARAHAGVVLALALPALWPLAQAIALAVIFDDQGVSLGTRDNPVVRAHLSLNRLVGAAGPAWIVHPGAVFGPVALAMLAGLALAWRRRRVDAGARVLVALAVVPCALLFVPGLAALAGRLWVPWMLYRLGWMVPVAPLLGYALVRLADGARAAGRRPVAAAALAIVVAGVAAQSAGDRLRRAMDEHPGQPDGAPVAAAAAVYDFLARAGGRAAVLAPPNFSELVPAISGKPVVAFPERGTLVFATDDTRAYERLRDRATFYASTATAAERDAIADAYGVRWAVLPRRQVASASESAWLWRFGPEALLAARAADECETCGNWWSATRAGLAARLSSAWTIAFETRDYFVVERDASVTAGRAPPPDAPAGRDTPAWLRPFALTPPAPSPVVAHVLATVTDTPGSEVTYAPPPRYIVPSVLPVWAEGPGAWEDAPAEAAITVDLGASCRVTAVEVVPHLPRERRDVLELRVGDGGDERVVRAAARHNASIFVPLGDAPARRSVTLRASSLIGNPVSLADVRLLGDRTGCDGNWPRHRRVLAPGLAAKPEALLALAWTLPPGGRALVSLARHVARERGNEAKAALLAEATRRQPSLVEAWIELGFAHDELAADATTEEAAAAAREAALSAFRGAVTADSNSAWAHGCLAWFERRSGHALRAMWQAVVAAQLDPTYADAWTVLGYALADVGLHGLAGRALDVAEDIDPLRNWPALARADLAVARGDFEAARQALRSWILRHPYDEAARSKLSDVAAAERR